MIAICSRKLYLDFMAACYYPVKCPLHRSYCYYYSGSWPNKISDNCRNFGSKKHIKRKLGFSIYKCECKLETSVSFIKDLENDRHI